MVPGLRFSISYTTRKPRGSEQDGREYFFITREQFERMIARGEFLEHAEVFGNYYGTAKRFLHEAEDSGDDLLLDIDVQGAAQIQKQIPDAVSIFVLPPSRAELERRLRRRSSADGVSSEEIIERRLRTASKEIENYSHYGYILVNDKLEESIDKLRAIVESERKKRSGAKLSGKDLELLQEAESCLRERAMEKVQPIVASFMSAIPSRG
jgi:guanylate kinase